jgi:hypothetical protein
MNVCTGAIATHDHGADVALLELVHGDELDRRAHELLDRVRARHAHHLCAAHQTLHVLGQAKDGGTVGGLVAADALEDAGTVVQGVREHMDLRRVPIDERPVHPDLVDLRQCGHV